MHEHHYSGQTLRHDHEGGDMPHGYYGHPEDYAAGDPCPARTAICQATPCPARVTTAEPSRASLARGRARATGPDQRSRQDKIN